MHKILNFQDRSKEKNINRKKIAIIIVLLVIIFSVLIMSICYSSNKEFRKFLDQYLFRKNVSEEKLASVQLDYDSNVNVIAHNKHICVLAENILRQYNYSGDLVNEIELKINNPIYSTSGKYLAISEKNSSKVYLLSNDKIIWEKEVDGNVSKIDVNKNGYVAVILTGTTYKSVIVTYNAKGSELFKTYLSSATALDATVSLSNEYLAFAEINTSGTLIQSNVKIVSIEEAETNPSESIIYTYEAPDNSLVTNIKYQNKNKLVCIYDDAIHVISNNEDEIIMNLKEDNKKINMADINLSNNVYREIEKNTGLFSADTVIEIMNIDNKKTTVYTIEGVAKNVVCYEDIIAINLGQQIQFINTSGWLIKNYTSSQDIQYVTIGNGIAGIIYRDRVEIINL